MDALQLAQQIGNRLGEIDGVVAVVLGGSRARGGASPDSDIDLGIYYRPDNPPAYEALQNLSAELDNSGNNAATTIGGWGPWINGGGWLKIRRTPSPHTVLRSRRPRWPRLSRSARRSSQAATSSRSSSRSRSATASSRERNPERRRGLKPAPTSVSSEG